MSLPLVFLHGLIAHPVSNIMSVYKLQYFFLEAIIFVIARG